MVGVLRDAAGVLANDNVAACECFAATIDRTYGTEIPRHPRALMRPGPVGQRAVEPDGSGLAGIFVPVISRGASNSPVTAAQAVEAPAFAVALGGIQVKTLHGWGTSMVRALELAIEALGNLPAADQERVGRQLLSYIEKLQQLRIEIERGVRVLEVEAGVPLDIEDFLLQLNQRHGRG